MSNSRAISIRIPDKILEKIDRIAEEKYKSHKGTPNRSLVVLDAIVNYFNILSDVNNLEDLGEFPHNVSIVEFNELRDMVLVLSDNIKQLKKEIVLLSDNSEQSSKIKKADRSVKTTLEHTQLSADLVFNSVLD